MMPFEGNDDLLKEKQRTQSLKVGLKEKVVQLYERHFSGEDITGSQLGFWEEFFLLRANTRYLQAHFEKCSWDELVCQKPQIHRLFEQSLEMAHSDHAIRRANSLQTLSALVRGAFSCRPSLQSLSCVVGPDGRLSPHPNLGLLAPPAAADRLLRSLLHRLCHLLLDEAAQLPIKALALNLLITMATACDLQHNPLLLHILSDRLFDCCMRLFASPDARCEFGESVCTLLALLLQADTSLVANPCLAKLAVLDDNLVLNGFSYVISLCLASYNELYRQRVKEPRGLLYSITNMVGHILVGEERGMERIEVQDALLLALFEALHVNSNFIATLTYSHTHQLSSMGQLGRTAEAAGQEAVPEPTNLLVVFLEYCSIIMQDTRDPGMFNSCKLCFLILIAVSEDDYANTLMHDMNMNFHVRLHRIPMRHKAPSLGVDVESAPLACALLDLLVEFCQSHLMRAFPVELYQYALLIVHRLLCYQKQAEVRLQYSWHHLWSAMFTCSRYALSCFNSPGAQLPQFRLALLSLLRHNCQLLNFFITFGDTFLPSCDVYDLLFYEIIRMRALFDDCCQLCQRLSCDPELKDAAANLERSLSNIRSIVLHFAPRIDEWAESNGQRCLTQEQVLAVVRANYDSLTLRLFTSLDAYTTYQELIPAEEPYFRQLTRKIVTIVRKDAFECSQRLQARLKDLSTLA